MTNDGARRQYRVTWKVRVSVLNLHHGIPACAQVVDSRRYGLPQRRRRLYILGSPFDCKVPMMRTKTEKMGTLRSFLSNRGKKEKAPSNLYGKKHSCPPHAQKVNHKEAGFNACTIKFTRHHC